MNSRITLGTVQFGMSYGVSNQDGVVDESEVASILEEAKGAGIDTLDTAINYGNSEAVLGSLGVKDFKVVSKLSDFPDGDLEVTEWTRVEILSSIERLGTQSLYSVLFHKPSELSSDSGPKYYEALNQLKLDGLIEKIGVSICAPEELKFLVANFDIDLVQAPLNIIDQRMVRSGWASELENRGIEFHTRSSFLQGLLLMKADERPEFFGRWQNFWDEWDQWLLETGLAPLQACIRYALSISEVERVVVGVHSRDQLKQIVSASHGPSPELPNWTATIDPELINPSLWKNL